MMLVKRQNGIAPVSGLRDVQRWMSEVLENPWTFDPWTAFGALRHTAVQVGEQDNEVLVTAELPGVDPQDIDVTLAENVLTIAVLSPKAPEGGSGDDASGSPAATAGHRFAGYRQSVALPCRVDPDHIEASSRHGVLTVHLRKPATDVPRRIRIKAS